MDPESEFPWHHPDAQIGEDSYKEEINLGEFYDPWDMYRGRIPPNREEMALRHSVSGRVENHEDMKKYAWEYKPHEDTPHHNYQEQIHHQHYDNFQSHHHLEHQWETHSQSHDQSAHMHRHQSYEPHYWQQHFHENKNLYHEENVVGDQYQHKHDHCEHKHNDHEHEHVAHVQNHDHHDHYHSQPIHHQSFPHYQSDNHSHHSHHDHFHKHSDHIQYTDYYTDTDSKKNVSHSVETVQHVRLDHETILSLHKQKEDTETPSKEKPLMNGDISDSDSDYYEEIRPRHPYDGFYLRHRATVDARGRKVCTHEIPPTPSPSLSDVESDDEFYTAETCSDDEDEHVSFLSH